MADSGALIVKQAAIFCNCIAPGCSFSSVVSLQHVKRTCGWWILKVYRLFPALQDKCERLKISTGEVCCFLNVVLLVTNNHISAAEDGTKH